MKTAHEKIDRKWHGSVSDSAQSLDSWAFSGRLIPDLTPASKIWPPRKSSPTRIAGRCKPRGGLSVASVLYPAIISTGRFTWTVDSERWISRLANFRHKGPIGRVCLRVGNGGMRILPSKSHTTAHRRLKGGCVVLVFLSYLFLPLATDLSARHGSFSWHKTVPTPPE